MRRSSVENSPARAALALLPCPEPACRQAGEAEGSGCEGSAVEELALPALSEAEGRKPKGSHACPFRYESRICNHSPLLLANRGYAELEMVPSPCKQRTTTRSNRGEMRVLLPARHPSRATHPASPKLDANRNIAELAIVPSCWKQRPTTLSNRHKIAFFSQSARMESRSRLFAALGR
jgi:hypothetical protein